MNRAGAPPTVSLILSTYNRPLALDRVLASALAQTSPPEQVLVADDGSTSKTAQVVARWQAAFEGRLQHVWQPDSGFRLAHIRNRAIRDATGDLIVLVDGDCLLRSGVIAGHRRLAEPGWAVAGNRVLLSESLTAAIEAGEQDPLQWHVADWFRARRAGQVRRLSPLLTVPGRAWRCSRPRHWLQFRGCNMGVWRQDLIRVNGFDEQISGWGFEDSDLAIRLINAGIGIKSGRFATAVLHLWHRESPRDRAEANREHAMRVQREQTVRAGLGLDERLPDDRFEAPHAQVDATADGRTIDPASSTGPVSHAGSSQ